MTPGGDRDGLFGQQLGAFRVERVLGSRAMGKVYSARVTGKAHGLAGGSRVALKIVHPHLLEKPGIFKRFIREADIGRAVEHPNVVRTLECDQLIVEGVHHNFLVMEYVEGQTLRLLQRELERVPEELCLHIAQEVAKGLAAIHAAHVIHRDIKPENVLITPEHRVKVMDLGVARLQDEAMRLSMTGHFLGSMPYAAPEQFRDADDAVGAATDLHALGVLLYELASGQRPYTGDDMRQLIHQITSVEPRRLGALNPQLSPFFEELVHTLLEKKAADRFSSAEELLEILAEGTASEWWHERERALRAATSQPLRRIRIPRDTAVYGRDEELTRLRELYDRAAAGEGQVLLVEGEAGIGKSRLIDEFVGRMREEDEDFDFLFGSYPPGGAATALGAFSTAYREQMGAGGAAEYLHSTPLLVPAFDALLRGDSAPTDCVPLTKESVQACFVHVTRALAVRRPTIILIDDLHFAPEEGQALFASLALAVPGQRVLLVGTLRSAQVSDEWIANVQRLDHVTRLPVPRLSPRDLVLLLGDTFRSERLAEELGAKIALKSDGNPFFVFEILRGMREGQFITQDAAGSWVSTRVIDEIQIPSTVLDLVNARVADLTEEERDLLDVASCWGFEFDPGLIGDVMGLGRIPLLKRFGQIERAHRLVRSSGRTYVFDHHQVQEALYGSLHEQLREEYHGAIAEALAARTNAAEQDPASLDGALCVDLCEHFLKGERGDSALRYLDAALEHLERSYQFAQVVSLGERAIEAADLLTGPERARLLLRLSNPLDTLGRRAAQEEYLSEAQGLAEAAADDGLRRQAANQLGLLYKNIGRWAEAEETLRLALELARTLGDERAEAGAVVNLGIVFRGQSRYDESEEHIERGRALCRKIGERRFEASAEMNLGAICHARGRPLEAQRHMERGLEISREIADRQAEALATINLGASLGNHLPEALEHLERGLALCREIGDRPGEAMATVNIGGVFAGQGRYSEAGEFFERALVLFREVGDRQSEAGTTSNLGTIALGEGRLPEARELLEQSLAIHREIGNRHGEAMSMMALANTSLREGRLIEVRRTYEELLVICREIGEPMLEAGTQANRGDLFLKLGDRVRARQAFEECVEVSRGTGADYQCGYGLFGLGRWAEEGGDLDEALRYYEESLALRREIVHGDGIVDSLTLLGSLQFRRRDIEAARAALEEAVASSRKLSRAGLIALSEALLACLPGQDSQAAEQALAEIEIADDSLALRWWLYRATGENEHLERAKRLLDEQLAMVPDEYHEDMRSNIRVNREVLAAWEGLESEGA